MASVAAIDWRICSSSFVVGSHPISTLTSSLDSAPDVFHALVSSDPHSNYRVWFHFAVAGGRKGKIIHITLKNWNNKKPLIGEGMRPIYRTASSTEWKRVSGLEYVTLQLEPGIQSFLRNNASAPSPSQSPSPSPPPTLDQSDAAHSSTVNEENEDGESGRSSGSDDADEDNEATLNAPSSVPSTSSRSTKKLSSQPKSKKPTKKVKHDTMELTIQHTFDSDEEVFFAFCLPQSYTDLQQRLMEYETKYTHPSQSSVATSSLSPPLPSSSSTPMDTSIYFHRELLIHTIEGRRIDLITVSSNRLRQPTACETNIPHLYPPPTSKSHKSADIRKMFPHDGSVAATNSSSSSSFPSEPRCSSFHASKPIIFISARVHPGETPSAYMFDGLLEWLLSHTDPRAAQLRDSFVIKLVPCLNPDGVAHGYYRTDTEGQNLNRFYETPNLELQPSIYAVRRLIEEYHSRQQLFFYIDLHAHATKRGLFIFGNHIDTDLDAHYRNIAYSKLVELNCPYLSINGCNFTKQNMCAKDARDGLSKEGAGRVAFYKMTGLKHCYTIEVNYHNSRNIHAITPLPEQPITRAAKNSSISSSSSSSSSSFDLSWQKDDYLLSRDSTIGPPVQYGPSHFSCMGKALLVSILDLVDANDWSRLPSSSYVSMSGVAEWARDYSMKPPKKLMTRLSKKSTKSSKQSPSQFPSPRPKL